MIRKLRYLLASTALLCNFGLLAAPALAHADDLKADACSGLNQLNNGSDNTDCGKVTGRSVDSILSLVIQIISVIVGFVAVIMVIVGGIKYVTSAGDAGAASSAKNTIVYALVGLVIVAVAQVLVHFILNKL